MGVVLRIVGDDFQEEKNYGYIDDDTLIPIINAAKTIEANCLSNVMCYENTMFNGNQMEQILNEIEQIKDYTKEEKINGSLETIKNAIDYARQDPPLYLLFDGD